MRGAGGKGGAGGIGGLLGVGRLGGERPWGEISGGCVSGGPGTSDRCSSDCEVGAAMREERIVLSSISLKEYLR